MADFRNRLFEVAPLPNTHINNDNPGFPVRVCLRVSVAKSEMESPLRSSQMTIFSGFWAS
jgi:hypothetical protein